MAKIHLMNGSGHLACESRCGVRRADVACYMVERWVTVPEAQRCKFCQKRFLAASKQLPTTEPGSGSNT